MGVGTLIRFLFGDREAILRLASSRWTLVIGLLFVLSAGFAREYDGEDLLHEPWHLLLPLGASLSASFVLFNLAFFRPWRSGVGIGYWSAYLSFLGLFWMTAPLAWLYAIPYERWFDELGAMKVNLLTLGLVALWRVVLMIRVLIVFLDYSWWWATQIVLLSSVIIFAVALVTVGPPIIMVMGGVRLTPAEAAANAAKANAWMGLICSSPFVLAGGIEALIRSRPRWMAPNPVSAGLRPKPGLWGLAIVSLLVWATILPLTQAPQQRRNTVERAFREGRTADTLAALSAHQPEDFPPGWFPPPNSVFGRVDRYGLDLLRAWKVIQTTAPSPWVRQVYLDKLRSFLGGNGTVWLDREEVEELCALLDSLPEAPQLVHEARESPLGDGRLKYAFLEYSERMGRSGEQALRRWKEVGGE